MEDGIPHNLHWKKRLKRQSMIMLGKCFKKYTVDCIPAKNSARDIHLGIGLGKGINRLHMIF